MPCHVLGKRESWIPWLRAHARTRVEVPLTQTACEARLSSLASSERPITQQRNAGTANDASRSCGTAARPAGHDLPGRGGQLDRLAELLTTCSCLESETCDVFSYLMGSRSCRASQSPSMLGVLCITSAGSSPCCLIVRQGAERAANAPSVTSPPFDLTNPHSSCSSRPPSRAVADRLRPARSFGSTVTTSAWSQADVYVRHVITG